MPEPKSLKYRFHSFFHTTTYQMWEAGFYKNMLGNWTDGRMTFIDKEYAKDYLKYHGKFN